MARDGIVSNWREAEKRPFPLDEHQVRRLIPILADGAIPQSLQIFL
jgi:hypothetical protein